MEQVGERIRSMTDALSQRQTQTGLGSTPFQKGFGSTPFQKGFGTTPSQTGQPESGQTPLGALGATIGSRDSQTEQAIKALGVNIEKNDRSGELKNQESVFPSSPFEARESSTSTLGKSEEDLSSPSGLRGFGDPRLMAGDSDSSSSSDKSSSDKGGGGSTASDSSSSSDKSSSDKGGGGSTASDSSSSSDKSSSDKSDKGGGGTTAPTGPVPIPYPNYQDTGRPSSGEPYRVGGSPPVKAGKYTKSAGDEPGTGGGKIRRPNPDSGGCVGQGCEKFKAVTKALVGDRKPMSASLDRAKTLGDPGLEGRTTWKAAPEFKEDKRDIYPGPESGGEESEIGRPAGIGTSLPRGGNQPAPVDPDLSGDPTVGGFGGP
jgi:hypothetical protein